MGGEEKVYNAQSDKAVEAQFDKPVEEMSLLEHWEYIQRLRRESASGESDEPEYEDVEMTDEQMEALSHEELNQHIDLYQKRVKFGRATKSLGSQSVQYGTAQTRGQSSTVQPSEIQWPATSRTSNGVAGCSVYSMFDLWITRKIPG